MPEDYCDHCDLPLSTCVHGRPPPPPPVAKPATRKAPAATSRTTRPKAPVKRVPRRWTPPEAMVQPILEVLNEAGGALDTDDLFAGLEERLVETLLDADRERTPEGELRWQYAARRARQTLIADGTMTKGQPGMWQLNGQ